MTGIGEYNGILYLPPSDSSGRDFGVVVMMTIREQKKNCFVRWAYAGRETAEIRDGRFARGWPIDGLSADHFVLREQRRQAVGKNERQRKSEWRSIVRVRFTRPTHEKMDNENSNGYREQQIQQTIGHGGQTRNERLDTWIMDKRLARTTTTPPRQHSNTARARTRGHHKELSSSRVCRCARASVVLLLWSPPAHPPASESTNSSTEHNNIVVGKTRARHVRFYAFRWRYDCAKGAILMGVPRNYSREEGAN